MIQNIIVGTIVLGCAVYILKHFMFKSKNESAGCGCGCDGCGGKRDGCGH